MNEDNEGTFTEKIQVAGADVVERVKELVAEGNVRRIVLRNDEGKTLLTVPMNLGAAVSGVAVLAAPLVVVLGVVAGMLARVTIEVERTEMPAPEEIIIEVEEVETEPTED